MVLRSEDGKEFSQAELLESPQPMAFDCLLGNLVVLLGGGIVNPYGPTLELVAGIGPWKPGQDMPVVRAMLNPFTQDITQVGVLRIRDVFNPRDALAAFLPVCQIGCPTALLFSPLLRFQPQQIMSIFGEYLSARESGDLVLENVRKFPGDPYSRVKHETDNAMAIIKARRGGDHTEWPEIRKLTKEDAVELATMQLRKDFLTTEWNAFVRCWLQSIEAFPMRNAAMPYATVEPVVLKVVDSTIKTLEDVFPSASGNTT